ncbi:MAG TPA: DinB family protein [Mycobacteriales bacterium]|nr:DinB family protein [Mycobacteriales bacterium]
MAVDPTVPGDAKDWTWVLEQVCPECGFDTRVVDPPQVGDLIRANAAAWQAVLARADVRTRPRPDVWSPLEYACHVRDVFELYDRRLELMLTTDEAQFQNWDQDVTAVERRYAEDDPAAVGPALTANAEQLASRFDSVAGDAWDRTGLRSDGALFTVSSFSRYLIHDPVHHLWDVGTAP